MFFCAYAVHVSGMLILYVLLVFLFEVTCNIYSLFVITNFNVYQDCWYINFQAWSKSCLILCLSFSSVLGRNKLSLLWCCISTVPSFPKTTEVLLLWNPPPFLRWHIFSSIVLLKISLVYGIWTCRSSSKHSGEMGTSPCSTGDKGDTFDLIQCHREENQTWNF